MRVIMLKIIPFVSILSFFLLLQGCASGSYELTGDKRPEIEPERVTLFTHKPTFSYQVIGKVKASSEKGFSDDARLEKAKEELKEQAAKIGANGIILDGVSESSFEHLGTGLGLSLGSGGVGTSIGSGFSLPKARITGQAIHYNEVADEGVDGTNQADQ